MNAFSKIFAGSAAIAALASAAPAAAQYAPDYPYGYGYGNAMPSYPYGYGNAVPPSPYGYGDTMPGYPYGYGGTVPGAPGPYGYGANGYGVNSQAAINQCESAVQARLNGGSAYGYGYSDGGGRVLGISRVVPLAQGGLSVRGVATSGHYGGYGYTSSSPIDLVWRCTTDFRGFVVGVDVGPAQRNYGNSYAPWNNDYSQYGYERY